MNKADKYLKETISDILENGSWDVNPRPKWADGSPAHSKFVTQKVFEYNIAKGEYPITTLRTTALKGAWYDIEAIYLKQTNVLEEMHPSIHSWWRDFIVKTLDKKRLHEKWLEWAYFKKDSENYGDKMPEDFQQSSLGATYGHTVLKYKLIDKLLKGLEENPFGRRHKISLWQEQQTIDDPKALEPCAGLTFWSVRDERLVIKNESGSESYSMDMWDMSNMTSEPVKTRYIDLTLIQRSQDFLTTSSINSIQYVMLGMAVCNHLSFKTGIKHQLGKFTHFVQNCHLYDNHIEIAKELLERSSTDNQPRVELICEPKDFYSHSWEDFKILGLEGIEKIKSKIPIAV